MGSIFCFHRYPDSLFQCQQRIYWVALHLLRDKKNSNRMKTHLLLFVIMVTFLFLHWFMLNVLFKMLHIFPKIVVPMFSIWFSVGFTSLQSVFFNSLWFLILIKTHFEKILLIQLFLFILVAILWVSFSQIFCDFLHNSRGVGSEFELQLRYYVHFRTNTLRIGIELSYTSSYG